MTEAEERLRDAVRLRHFSRHTEKPHVFWLKSKALSVRHSVLSARPKPSEESSSFFFAIGCLGIEGSLGASGPTLKFHSAPLSEEGTRSLTHPPSLHAARQRPFFPSARAMGCGERPSRVFCGTAAPQSANRGFVSTRGCERHSPRLSRSESAGCLRFICCYGFAAIVRTVRAQPPAILGTRI